jgi:hypothetical protein
MEGMAEAVGEHPGDAVEGEEGATASEVPRQETQPRSLPRQETQPRTRRALPRASLPRQRKWRGRLPSCRGRG